ncbi:hypothetical protein [Terasakiella sp. SH-1]|uniref:hypothetical protein n=1 Tax=Terasakiella sp. SH-1 TaxID=2560057 RepID=UPI00107334D5|nr:hypothetical protein [Terasakiella sp. SH-1]
MKLVIQSPNDIDLIEGSGDFEDHVEISIHKDYLYDVLRLLYYDEAEELAVMELNGAIINGLISPENATIMQNNFSVFFHALHRLYGKGEKFEVNNTLRYPITLKRKEVPEDKTPKLRPDGRPSLFNVDFAEMEKRIEKAREGIYDIKTLEEVKNKSTG